jgi:hypothetical protein
VPESVPVLREITPIEPDAPDALPEATISDAINDIVKYKFAQGLTDAADNVITLASENTDGMSAGEKRITLDAARYVIEFNIGKPEGHGKDDPLDKLLEAIRGESEHE